jgi:hypothetical protein
VQTALSVVPPRPVNNLRRIRPILARHSAGTRRGHASPGCLYSSTGELAGFAISSLGREDASMTMRGGTAPDQHAVPI